MLVWCVGVVCWCGVLVWCAGVVCWGGEPLMLVMMKDQGDNVTMAAVDVTTEEKHGEHGGCGTCS